MYNASGYNNDEGVSVTYRTKDQVVNQFKMDLEIEVKGMVIPKNPFSPGVSDNDWRQGYIKRFHTLVEEALDDIRLDYMKPSWVSDCMPTWSNNKP